MIKRYYSFSFLYFVQETTQPIVYNWFEVFMYVILNVYTCTSIITMSLGWSTDISPTLTRDELGTSYSLGSTATFGSSVHADALVLIPQVSILLSTDSSSLYDWMISPSIVCVTNRCRHQQEKNKSNAT